MIWHMVQQKGKHMLFRKRTLRRKHYGSLLDLAHHCTSMSQAQALTAGHVTDRSAQAEARSPRLHPQKYHMHCKSLWTVSLEISEGLSCSGKEEQMGTRLPQSPAGRVALELFGVSSWGSTPETWHIMQSELHGGACPCCNQHTECEKKWKYSVMCCTEAFHTR